MNSARNDSSLPLDSLTVCLDMQGCPNRCRHCWMGHGPNGHLTEDDLRFVHDAFRPHARVLELHTWTREPDFRDDYRELWALRAALSDVVTPHFELMSVWRAARDPAYVPWLREMGVRRMQLTLFGGEALTGRDREMLAYVLSSGTYGTTLHRVENRVAAFGGGRKGRLRFVAKRLFPSAETLRDYYPVVYRHRILLPFLFVYRVGKGLSVSRRKVRGELRALLRLPPRRMRITVKKSRAPQKDEKVLDGNHA